MNTQVGASGSQVQPVRWRTLWTMIAWQLSHRTTVRPDSDIRLSYSLLPEAGGDGSCYGLVAYSVYHEVDAIPR